MTKVITYGTYDLLHYGHIKLLERAKALGDYLVVGVTADDFDRNRGKINVQQSLMERVEAVRQTGLADEIIVEEYEGQKIDDIKRLGIDIFTVGSDWVGKFDYLNEYCKVVYLDRTQGISSSEIRSKKNNLRLGIVGNNPVVNKFIRECSYVNGIEVIGIYTDNEKCYTESLDSVKLITHDYSILLDNVEAVYVLSVPKNHSKDIRIALENGKHVICESPIALNPDECIKLFSLAKEKGLILMEAIKTAYSTAYSRMILLAKSGRIGEVVSVDATCTSLKDIDVNNEELLSKTWNSLTSWGPTALLPVFQLLGTDYSGFTIFSRIGNEKLGFDEFTKIAFHYPSAVASIKVGVGVKSEGELIISGTKGYIYVPAPWWKTDYFEIRYEKQEDNKRYFYQLDGEGIRNEIVAFLKLVENKGISMISERISVSISSMMQNFKDHRNLILLKS